MAQPKVTCLPAGTSATSTTLACARTREPTGTGDGKADLVDAVVELRARGLEAEDLGAEHRDQREGQVAVGDGPAERPGRRALDVDVDPLVVTGRLGEGVHAVLLDRQPVAGAEVLADGGGDVLEAGEGPHRGNLAGLRGSAACPSPPESPPPPSRSPAPPRRCCTTTSTAGCGPRRSSSWPPRSATSCPHRTPSRSVAGSPSRPNSGSLERYLETFDHTVAVMQQRRRDRPRRPGVRGGPGGRRRRVRRGALRTRAARDRRAVARRGGRRRPARLRRGHGRYVDPVRHPDRGPPAAHGDAPPGPLAGDRGALGRLARPRCGRVRHRGCRGRLSAHPPPRRVRVPPAGELPLHHPRRRGVRAAVDLAGDPVVRRRPARPRCPDHRRHHGRRR